jgi:hypothetical protein
MADDREMNWAAIYCYMSISTDQLESHKCSNCCVDIDGLW